MIIESRAKLISIADFQAIEPQGPSAFLWLFVIQDKYRLRSNLVLATLLGIDSAEFGLPYQVDSARYCLSVRPTHNSVLFSSELLDLVIVHQGNDYITFFVPCFNIAVGFSSLLQGIALINDGFNDACLNQLFDANQIFTIFR